jgi:acyl-CoA dehydrogenase
MTLLPNGRATLLTATRELTRDVLAPIAAAAVPGRVSREVVAALGEHGVMPRIFPREHGGSADGPPTATELCVLREAMASESPTVETTFAVQGLGSHPILQAGSVELARRWIPAVARGEAVAGFALSEPGAGSDAAALSLAAEADGPGWRLTGTKTWISHAPDADVYTVFARTTPGVGARGVTAFAVPGEADGLSGEPIELIAPHALGTLEFDGVRVEPEQLLGEPDAGFRVAMGTLDRFRPSVGAAAVGLAQRALDAALAHAGQREAFGGPLRELQSVAHRLADAATAVESARLLVYEAAATLDAGHRATRLAAMAKLHATEAAQRVVDDAVQVHGAAGLVAGGTVGELYREVRSLRIYEGASEVQRTIIARELFRDVSEATRDG